MNLTAVFILMIHQALVGLACKFPRSLDFKSNKLIFGMDYTAHGATQLRHCLRIRFRRQLVRFQQIRFVLARKQYRLRNEEGRANCHTLREAGTIRKTCYAMTVMSPRNLRPIRLSRRAEPFNSADTMGVKTTRIRDRVIIVSGSVESLEINAPGTA